MVEPCSFCQPVCDHKCSDDTYKKGRDIKRQQVKAQYPGICIEDDGNQKASDDRSGQQTGECTRVCLALPVRNKQRA